MQICQAELFGPAVAIAPYDTLDEAIELANSTPYGLQASIFTSNLKAALYAAERLDFGGVHVNEVSSYRADHMPYGGVKASGMGREGPRYAIEEMSETKIIIITQTCRRKPRPFMAGRNAAFLILGFGGGAFKRLFVHLFSFLDMPLNIWYKRKYENGDNGKAQTVSHARTVRGIASNATGLS